MWFSFCIWNRFIPNSLSAFNLAYCQHDYTHMNWCRKERNVRGRGVCMAVALFTLFDLIQRLWHPLSGECCTVCKQNGNVILNAEIIRLVPTNRKRKNNNHKCTYIFLTHKVLLIPFLSFFDKHDEYRTHNFQNEKRKKSISRLFEFVNLEMWTIKKEINYFVWKIRLR